jgi:hypothetical protein
MAELNWQGKSKEMFQKLIEGSPKPFRAMTEKKMLEGLAKKSGDAGSVTEDMVVEVVKEITPKPFIAMALKSIEPLMTSK